MSIRVENLMGSYDVEPARFDRLRATAVRAMKPFALRTASFALAIAASMFTPSLAQAVHCNSPPSPGLDWSNCNKRKLMLERSNLEGATLISADFTSSDLRGTNLNSANLEKATLVRASLAGASVQRANFASVEAYRISFVGAFAERASFVRAGLQRADFSRARLTGANFEKAELGRANFKGAVLTGTKFSQANLSRADLSLVIFEGPIEFDDAFMYLTRIEGLDLSAASGLQQAQIGQACGDAATKLPAGFSRPANWPCAFD